LRLPFLDFSSLEQRHRAALRELELNAPHAPGLYRDAMPITRGANGLELGGSGEVVDWVTCMARVPEEDFLDVIAARGGLTPALLDALGDAVAAYHAALEPQRVEQVAALGRIIEGNQRSAEAAEMEPDAVGRWTDAAGAALAERAGWLRRRAGAGFVRRGHGDLHLGNLCLWQGRPVPFDALEFNEALALVDVGYDLAFLLMDLDVRAGRAAANRVMNRVLALSGDVDVLSGLPLFLSVRAMVRAHIAAARGREEESAAYLGHAFAYLAPKPPVMVAIGGLPGTGKSTLARALAPSLGAAPGAVILRSDEIRKRRHGVAPETRLPQSAYGTEASRAVFATMAEAAKTALRAGHAVIADATFMAPYQREAVEHAAGDTHFLGVWLQAPIALLQERIAARHGDASDADLAVLRRAAAGDPGAGRWLAVESREGSAALERLRAVLGPQSFA
jgi:aminoglycoside phosphotransferase family enzyme/predicted kinase